MDFYKINMKENQKTGAREIYPDFLVGRSKDLMVRGKSFYAIWDEDRGLWSTDEYDVVRLVDQKLKEHSNEHHQEGVPTSVKYLQTFENGLWSKFQAYLKNISDSYHPLDESLTFANSEVKKTDYVSRRLPYSLSEGDISAWDELVGTLYSVEERAKIEWTIGAIVSGDSKRIQKFLVLYGPAGTGKSTILNIIQKLFSGYTTTFEAKALGSSNGTFSTEVFKSNPLVAIQHDGDLSKLEDNTRLNSIVSHEDMTMNEKFKASYTSRVNAFLFMGTNQPVKISDSKSGLIRRLIDVHPTGVKIPANHYNTLISKIEFELGAVAHHCLGVYRSMGKNHYNAYRPLEMMLQTDVFFNFIEYNFDLFKSQDSTTLMQAYGLYKEYCADTGIDRIMPQYKFREELKNYFEEFKDRGHVDGHQVRNFYSGFTASPFKAPAAEPNTFSLVIEETESLLDEVLMSQPAQYHRVDEFGHDVPKHKWANVTQILADIDTSKLHFVKVPENHIVIDFDLKDDSGDKSLERNLEAASVWPATYAELSQGGAGVHLHYAYDGDVSQLANLYSEGVEVKTLLGDASLRRRFTRGNNIPIATISGGLPLKEKKVLSTQKMNSEKGLRELIERNLKKEIHPGTKPSIDFIAHILEEAYEGGMEYDVSDLRPRLIAFANNSSHQPLQSLKIVMGMRFQGQEPDSRGVSSEASELASKVNVFYDVEVYPNLFVICWSYEDDDNVIRMINPTPAEVELLFKLRLIGFNNRRYDNHMLYARFMGYSNLQLFQLSQKIIANNTSAMFGEGYNLSWTDIYDYASEKKSLKMWQIELGLPHLELDIPWDQPVPEELWPRVVDYCVNDVVSTKAVHKHRIGDFKARLILAELSGLTPNHTTNQHTARILFNGDKNAQESFKYTHLSEGFPGYVFDMGQSTYRGEITGEGGYVYAEPGIYSNVAVLDVASMHPTSIEQLDLFGPYTKNFAALTAARLAIKQKDYDSAGTMLGGKLKPYLNNPAEAKQLSDALKIAINSVYGMTSAKFDNPFKDHRNKDNIVAKRGALFMIDLKHFVQELGYQVVHIKTDSIKIPNADQFIIDAVMTFGKKYGYAFEHEVTYDKFCLVNDAVYIARKGDHWDAVGAQFQHPYVFKKLFSHEKIGFEDYCETKQVNAGTMYIDFDAVQKPMFEAGAMQFIGRVGKFVPVTERSGGGVLYRVKDDKLFHVGGTKGYLWIESGPAKAMGRDLEIDKTYFEDLIDKAIKTINKFGSYEELVK